MGRRKRLPPKPRRQTRPKLTRAQVDELVADHTPPRRDTREIWRTHRGLIVDAVTATGTTSDKVARRTAWAVIDHIAFASDKYGLGERLWLPEAVEWTVKEYAVAELDVRVATVRETGLAAAAQGMAPHLWPQRYVSPLEPTGLLIVLTEDEIVVFERHRYLIGSAVQYRNFNCAYSLILGTGVIAVRDVRGSDLTERDSQLWLRVPDPDRTIPVAEDQADYLRQWVGVDEPLLTTNRNRALAEPFKKLGIQPPTAVQLRTAWSIRRLRAGASPAAIRWARGDRFAQLDDLLDHLEVDNTAVAALADNPPNVNGVAVEERYGDTSPTVADGDSRTP